jgi:hypothetical protein
MSIENWQAEIIKAPPTPLAGQGPAPIDVAEHITRDGWGSINRAVERDLLSFRTGDMTLTFDNPDRYFDDLFSDLNPTDRWTLRVHRDAKLMFQGVILGMGSILFDRKLDNCELTAYGPTRILEDTSAESVTRTFGALTVTTATSGTDTLTINDTSGLLTSDQLHITDHVEKEDVTVLRVLTSTTVKLTANLQNTYASGSPVTMETPFYRYKSIEFLVAALFSAASIPVAELRLSGSQFSRLAPTGVNLGGLDLTQQDFRTGMGEKDGKVFVTLQGGSTYSQVDPDDAWTTEDATSRSYADWSKYFVQDSAPPNPIVRGPTQNESGAGASLNVDWATGWDYNPATGVGTESTNWFINFGVLVGGLSALWEAITDDGDTYTAVAPATSHQLPAGNQRLAGTTNAAWTVEYDSTRSICLVGWRDTDGNNYFYQFTPATNAWVDATQGDDTTHGYYGHVFVPELDAILCLRVEDNPYGPAFEICAFRGTTRLWKKPFPSCYVVAQESGASHPGFWPTRTLRYVNGSLYCVAVSDGAVQLIRTDDTFDTFVMRKLFDNTKDTTAGAMRHGSQYRVNVYDGTEPRGYLVAAPFYAGVIDYADHAGISIAEALQNLAEISNAVFWLDDNLQGHFVARDLIPTGVVREIDDLVMEREDLLHWDEIKQGVTVDGGGEEETSGVVSADSESLSVSSDLVPNAAFAQALADGLLEFYSKRRRAVEVLLLNSDADIYYPYQRVMLDGNRWIVSPESNQDAPNDEVWLKLLEYRENP